MLKILQARLQQYVNLELPDVQAVFRKGRGNRDEIANIHWIIEKQEHSRRTHLVLLHGLLKPLPVWNTNKLWKIFQEMGISDHLTCLLGNLYAGQEATVRMGHGKTNWLQIGRGVLQGYISSPYLLNFYAECCAMLSQLVVSDYLQPHGL